MKQLIILWFTGIFGLLGLQSLFAQLPSIPDTLKILALRVEFQPDEAATTTGNGTFDLSDVSTAFQIDPPPHNRSYFQDHLVFARNYYHKISRGQLHIIGDVFPLEENVAYRLDEPMIAYNPNTSARAVDEGVARLMRDALLKADADPAIDFARYNTIIIFHAGVGRDIDIGIDDTPQDIPSLYLTSSFLQRTLAVDGFLVDGGEVTIRNAIILPETESQVGLQLGLNGVMASNLGSHLGFSDLFSPEQATTGVGRFALMDAGLFNADGLLPALPMAWTRTQAGWETPMTIFQAQRDEFEIHQVLAANPARVYRVPINQREYYLLENRYAGSQSLDSLQAVLSDTRQEFVSMREILETNLPDAVTFSPRGVLIDVDNPDRGLPGSGVLIWHIDENIIDATRAANRINNDPKNRGVDLEEADGSQDIGEEFSILTGIQNAAIGWPLDLWYAGNPAPLFEAAPANEFSANSTPNSNSNQNDATTNISIGNFSGPGPVMSFEVTLDIYQNNFPRYIDPAVYGRVTSLKVVDTNIDDETEIVLTTDRNKLLVIDEAGTSPWGSDSLEAIQIPTNETLITPPAFSLYANGDVRITLLTREGIGYNYLFDRSSDRLTSLQRALAPQATFTTFPIAPENGPDVFWGAAEGNRGIVYRFRITDQNTAFDAVGDIPEPVAALHFFTATEAIVIGVSGIAYNLNGVEIGDAGTAHVQPVGESAVGASGSLLFNLLDDQLSGTAGDAYRIDAPLVAAGLQENVSRSGQSIFAAVGDNQLLVFNDNLTLRSNFPIRFHTPAKTTNLFISPLLGDVTPPPANSTQSDPGDVIAVDPAGLIVGYDLSGEALPYFPIALGDSIRVSPALLDIDDDGDIELASVTKSGVLYVWDLPADFDANRPQSWPQQYATPGNTNLAAAGASAPGADIEGLLPEKLAYNWPNPNVDNVTFIRYRLTDVADVTIRIYDLAGDLVAELPGTGFANTDNEVRWDLTNVQSGVYLGRIEAVGGSQTGVQVIKIAVVK